MRIRLGYRSMLCRRPSEMAWMNFFSEVGVVGVFGVVGVVAA
jgi:hypothetical protein